MFRRLRATRKTERIGAPATRSRASAHETGISKLGLALALGMALSLVALVANPFRSGGGASTPAQASGGDFSLDFIAAAPQTYNHLTTPAVETSAGSLQYDARLINDDVVESLEAKDFACQDTIVFFTQVVVDAGATGTQAIDLHYDFDAQNNGQAGVGYKQVVAAGVSNVDFAGQTQETGNHDTGSAATASLTSQSYDTGTVPASFGTAHHLFATVHVTGLDAGDTIIVRVDVRYDCFAPNPTGNLHAALASAAVTSGGPKPTIQVGQQDIPMIGFGAAPTSTPTNTPTNTPVPPTSTPTNTNTPTETATNTPVPPTETPTNTNTPTETATNTPTETATNTPTETATNTPTETATNTPTETATNTPTETATNTPTETATNTPTETATNTPTETATNTPTETATATNTPSGSVNPNTPTHTPVPPTSTNTAVPPTATNTAVVAVAGARQGPILMPNTGMGSLNSGSGRMIVGALMVLIALGGLAIRIGMNRRSR
jgi:hypothetical protein